MGGAPALIAFRTDPGMTAWYHRAVDAGTDSWPRRSEWVARSGGREPILAGVESRPIDTAMQFGVKWRPLGRPGAGVRTLVIRPH